MASLRRALTHAFHAHPRVWLAATLMLTVSCGGVSNRLNARLELKKANQAYLAGDFREAIRHYDRAVSLVPDLAPAHLYRGYSHEALFRASESLDERRGLADSAAVSFLHYRQLAEAGRTKGVDNPPGPERIDEHVLTLYLDSLQPHKASELLAERLRTHPNDMASLQMLANLSVEQGDVDNALRWARRRLELAPDEPEGHVALAVMSWQFSNRSMVPDSLRAALLDEGVRASERAIELKPDYFEAFVYANLLYREKAKYAENAAERAEYEKKYTEYQEKARQVREQQKKDDAGATSDAGKQRTDHGGIARARG